VLEIAISDSIPMDDGTKKVIIGIIYV